MKEILEKELNMPPEKLDELLAKMENSNTGKRDGKQPPPEGGISLRAASRKYGIALSTLSRWIQRGYVPILERTSNELYVEEKKLVQIIELYKSRPGRGRCTIKRHIEVHNGF